MSLQTSEHILGHLISRHSQAHAWAETRSVPCPTTISGSLEPCLPHVQFRAFSHQYKCLRWRTAFSLDRPHPLCSTALFTTAMTLRLLFLSLYLYFNLPCVQASILPDRRDVTSTSKAGLAWPNAGSVDIRQFSRTGKVSWYVFEPFIVKNNQRSRLYATPSFSNYTGFIRGLLRLVAGMTKITLSLCRCFGASDK
jgi:hypothetical protein